jgi:succinyl-diaminopimelate desuccinylase
LGINEIEREALSKVDKREITRLTSSLVKIPSVNPPGKEKEVADFIVETLEKRGIQHKIISKDSKRPIIIAEIRGKGALNRTLIFNGHTDVVPISGQWKYEPFSGIVEDGKIFGRGASDMKGGLACMINALHIIQEFDDYLSGRLVFCAVPDEETGGIFGTAHLINEGIKGDFAIIGEPTELKVCTAHKGNLVFELMTFGREAHASLPDLGVNAIYKMVDAITELLNYSNSLSTKMHPQLGIPTINVGKIEGGTKSNIVPGTCKIVGERRFLPQEDVKYIKEELSMIFENLAKKDKFFSYDLKFLTAVEASEVDPSNNNVKLLLQCVADVTKNKALVAGFPATCDAYYFNKSGTPTVIFGPGSLKHAHGVNEHIEINELEIATKIYILIALRFLSGDGVDGSMQAEPTPV